MSSKVYNPFFLGGLPGTDCAGHALAWSTSNAGDDCCRRLRGSGSGAIGFHGLTPTAKCCRRFAARFEPPGWRPGLIAKKIPSVLRIVVLGRTAYMAPGRRPGGFFWGGLPGAGGAGRTVAYLKQHLSSSDGKPVQQIERKGVGEELTTCGGYPGRTRGHTL